MQLLTIANAAKKLKITRQRLYVLIDDTKVDAKGKPIAPRIPSIEIDGMRFIDMDTQDRWTWSKNEEETNTPNK